MCFDPRLKRNPEGPQLPLSAQSGRDTCLRCTHSSARWEPSTCQEQPQPEAQISEQSDKVGDLQRVPGCGEQNRPLAGAECHARLTPDPEHQRDEHSGDGAPQPPTSHKRREEGREKHCSPWRQEAEECLALEAVGLC